MHVVEVIQESINQLNYYSEELLKSDTARRISHKLAMLSKKMGKLLDYIDHDNRPDLLNITEASEKLKISMSRVKSLELPKTKLGRRYFYDAAQIERMRKKIQTNPFPHRGHERFKLGYKSIADIAKMSKVSPISIQHRISTGVIPRPSHAVEHLPGFYYSEEEAEKIVSDYLKMKDKHISRRLSGYYSVMEMSKKVNIHPATLHKWIKEGYVSPPVYVLEGFNGLFYFKIDVVNVLEEVNKHKKETNYEEKK